MGIILRLNQGSTIDINHGKFYALMTTHGLTMIGIWNVAGMVGVNYLLSRYVDTSLRVNVASFIATVIGVVLLWVSTFIGNFHAGWTFLYPLPIHNTAWPDWATILFFVSLAILAVSWLVWAISLLNQIFKKYSLRQVLAWQHLSKNSTDTTETPPMILISAVSLIGVVTCLVAAIAIVIMFLWEFFSETGFVNDALLMKNLIYFFGHTLANEMLYLGLAVLYEIMPEITGRPKFKTTWYIALGWNATLVFVLTAFFHHMYMDFVQPEAFQVIGQLGSYFASIPASAVTIFSVITLVYKQKARWTMATVLFFIGILGWAVGGVGAVIDATISNNIFLHNTLWVPAHFHTYNAMGNVMFIMAFFYWFGSKVTGTEIELKSSLFKVGLLIFGGIGFVMMFYFGGAHSVPRRFAAYPDSFAYGKLLANAGAFFATVYLVGIFIMFLDIIKKCIKVFSAA